MQAYNDNTYGNSKIKYLNKWALLCMNSIIHLPLLFFLLLLLSCIFNRVMIWVIPKKYFNTNCKTCHTHISYNTVIKHNYLSLTLIYTYSSIVLQPIIRSCGWMLKHLRKGGWFPLARHYLLHIWLRKNRCADNIHFLLWNQTWLWQESPE